MAAEIRVPEFGESVSEATVARWLKQQGEHVSAGEAVVELETEKANVEVGAPQPGVLARIDRKQGEDVRVGDVLGAIEDKQSQVQGPPREQKPVPTAAASGPVAGSAQRKPSRPEEKRSDAALAEPGDQALRERATRLAARVAKEQGIDLSRVSGTGPGGRVTREDVESHLAGQKQEAPAGAAPAPFPLRAPGRAERPPAESAAGPVRTEPGKQIRPEAGEQIRPEVRQRMSRRRQTIARRMLEAAQTTAMLTSFNEVDMTAVIEIRKRQKEAFQRRYGVNLGIASFFVQAAISALRDFPVLNAEVQGDEIVLKHYYDIGIAVGAADGLVVPVLRDADRMSFAEIEQSIRAFAKKAEEKTLSLEDLRGGTFTITNGGVFGSLLSTPILNPPQSGILGLHKIADRPVVRNKEIVIRPMMNTALTYDHRIVDGREAVQFLVRITELIESPEQLLLGT